MSRIMHFEIPAKDPSGLKKFYGEVFGWKFKKWAGPTDYWMITTGDKKEPGIDGGMERQKRRGVVNIITVKNIDSTIKKIGKKGGKLTVPKTPVKGMGWVSYFKDPDGNTLGAFQEDRSAAK